MNVNLTPTINRFEVIDHTGRAYVAEGVSIAFEYQDAGRTLKAFVTPGEPMEREKGWLGKLLAREKVR